MGNEVEWFADVLSFNSKFVFPCTQIDKGNEIRVSIVLIDFKLRVQQNLLHNKE